MKDEKPENPYRPRGIDKEMMGRKTAESFVGDDLSYRELDEEGRYVDATGDPVDEDYDEQERLLHLKDAEYLFKRIVDSILIGGEEQ